MILKIIPTWQWLAYIRGRVLVPRSSLMLTVVLLSAAVFIWVERKVSGRIQDRLGPTRVGGRFGWLQALADGLKLIAKEDIIPAGADGLLFRLAPYISFCRVVYACTWPCRLPTAGWPLRLDIGRVLHPGRGRAGGLRRDPGRLRLGARSGRSSGRCARRPRWSATKFPWACASWCRC